MREFHSIRRVDRHAFIRTPSHIVGINFALYLYVCILKGKEIKSMNYTHLLPGARKVLDCGNLKPGENIVIVTDTKQPSSISMAIFDAANSIGAHPVLITMNPVLPAGDLPEPINAALRCADLIVTPTSTSLYHSKGIREAYSAPNHARVIALSEITEDALINGGMTADFKGLKPLVEKLAFYYSKGSSIRYTTPKGTDLSANIAGRESYWISGVADKPGMLLALPTTEVYIAPVEDSVFGTIVVDASCSGGVGLVDEPIIMTVQQGKITAIRGGTAASKLKSILAAQNNPKAYQIAEFGLGLNPQCRVIGTTEDEGRYGTCHIGIGSNIGFGGVNAVPIHLDVIMWHPTIEIDGEMIFQQGETLVRG